MKSKIIGEISSKLDELFEISRFLYENPELGGEEHKAEKVLTEWFDKYGFKVEHSIYGLDTAFRATYNSKKEGAIIAFLCEYDALPQIGHGCGHNLISAMSMGAALGLKSVLDEIGGKIIILGTPSEETNGAKAMMVERGAFKDVTVAMMVHPSNVTEESGTSLALNALQFQFTGKAAHAAAAPEKGINALDGVIQLYNGINALRQHLTSDIRIHGIITAGGVAPNIVPDFAEARFYIRAQKKENLAEVLEKIKDCAHGAAKMTGTKVTISFFENSYDNLKTNKSLSALFNANLKSVGEREIKPPSNGIGSIDIGNVSNVVPAIHPWIGMGDPEIGLHTKEFADNTITEKGKETIYKGAYAMAMTAYDVIISKENQNRIYKEFIAQK